MSNLNQESFRKNAGRILYILFILFLSGSTNFAQDWTIPGKIATPYPTLRNLAIEWYIQGDENQNGFVKMHFREKGKNDWEQGMPLRRVPAGKNQGFSWKNKYSGSIFNLKPDT